ncbi:uncharacterized protein VP01_356g4 [Puccinia sorghi]|uniref:Uncharacterized protein n=1 Tax=Puccinia sorghi TaxID=27349 RepID=A0A0L6UV98_9BASI|nr:uncharacterized protein VP01_356g4 [Puccinia sorghi]
MGVSNVRASRVLLHVALMTLSLAVIGLTIKGRDYLTARRREVAELIPGGTLEAKSLVGVGVVLIITCIQICILAVLNSICILKDKVSEPIRGWCPPGLITKSMALTFVQLTAINIAQTTYTATRSARVSSISLADDVVQWLVVASGRSLFFRDIVVVVDYTVISWIIWLLLIIAICVESSKYSRPEYDNTEKEQSSK